jgi:hypothetical protein
VAVVDRLKFKRVMVVLAVDAHLNTLDQLLLVVAYPA